MQRNIYESVISSSSKGICKMINMARHSLFIAIPGLIEIELAVNFMDTNGCFPNRSAFLWVYNNLELLLTLKLRNHL